MTFNNYPIKASENAEAGYVANLYGGKKCKNSIGVKTAIKLINREGLSETFVKKIYSYLSRAKVYSYRYGTCGWISYNLWGGNEMLNWCKKILNKKA